MRLKRMKFFRIKSRFGDDIHGIEDMLRYDLAFQSLKDPAIIALPVVQARGGNLGGQLTEGRWHSFGMKIELLSPSEQGHWKESYREEDFRTFVHVPPDYAALIPVTLAQFLRAKDLYDLTTKLAKAAQADA